MFEGEELCYHQIIGPDIIIGISNPTDEDIYLGITLLENFRHSEYIKKKLKSNMVIDEREK